MPGIGCALPLAGPVWVPEGELDPRAVDRAAFFDGLDDESDTDPVDPVVSAAAMAGRAMMAAPTPRATASAPTRPT